MRKIGPIESPSKKNQTIHALENGLSGGAGVGFGTGAASSGRWHRFPHEVMLTGQVGEPFVVVVVAVMVVVVMVVTAVVVVMAAGVRRPALGLVIGRHRGETGVVQSQTSCR